MIGPGSVTTLLFIAGAAVAASILTYSSIRETELTEAKQSFTAALTFQLSSFSDFFASRRTALHGVADSISATSTVLPNGTSFARVGKSEIDWVSLERG